MIAKKALALLLGTVFTCSMAAAIPVLAESGETYTIKLSYVQNDKDPLSQGLYYLADNLKERTNGQIQVEVVTSGLLGDTGDVLAQVQTGMDLGLLLDAGRLADYVPEMNIFDAPYLFNSYEEANKFAQSDMFRAWMDTCYDQADVKVCSWNWYQGPRNYWTNIEVKTVDDLKGLKIRTGSSAMWQASISAMGAEPVSLGWNETYQSIQQKVCDGTESQVPGAYGISLNEVCKYMTRTEHFQLLTGLAVSRTWFDKLPEDLQEIFVEECEKAGEYASQITLDSIGSMEQEMADKGLIVNDVDKTSFIEATKAAYDQFEGYSELAEQIREIVEAE